MEVRAHHKNIRLSARKMRVLRGMLLGLPAAQAAAQLKYRPGKASQTLLKVLRSAIANARHNFSIEEDKLQVAEVVIDSGLSMKRMRPSSRGSAKPILKRMSHVTFILEETGEGMGQERKARKSEIETLTAEELMREGRTAEVGESPSEEVAKEVLKDTGIVPHQSKSEEAFQKMKAQQQGGDAHKTHRRKTLGN